MNSNCHLAVVVDEEENRRSLVNSLFDVLTYSSHDEIDNSLKIDLVVTCTRPSSHKFFAEYFVKHHINVLVTKPC